MICNILPAAAIGALCFKFIITILIEVVILLGFLGLIVVFKSILTRNFNR